MGFLRFYFLHLENHPQMKKQKELEIDVELYALKYKNADNASQQKIKSDLQAALNQLFDIRESQKQDEVKQLQKRLQELQESLQARKQNKNEIHPQELVKTILEHAKLQVKNYGEYGLVLFRKHLMFYLKGLSHSKELKIKLTQVTSLSQLDEILKKDFLQKT